MEQASERGGSKRERGVSQRARREGAKELGRAPWSGRAALRAQGSKGGSSERLGACMRVQTGNQGESRNRNMKSRNWLLNVSAHRTGSCGHRYFFGM